MEIANLIINIVGYIVLGSFIWLLRNQVKLQKITIDSQDETIKNMKMFVDIFQPEKVNEYVRMREGTFDDIKNKEIGRIKSEMEEKLKKRSDVTKLLSLNLFYYVDRESRKEALERSPDTGAKSDLIKSIETFPYHGDIYRNALLQAFGDFKSPGKHLKES